ncbi:protein kinase PK4, putative [Plasmodium gallinaceum]|uniref:Eukaryotic translation initiation factor 2-alpha kinase PK4 n=1 Tax=Plasmodium gallinaceum TaxID=5849 RepID=A0A1J1GS40_PLAGA|nr:protein kinase PK4, putative [Plasmodium gallinaceum]CRG93859.1 protein kinase PK4, putative [Plasmodium gallinaceum]
MKEFEEEHTLNRKVTRTIKNLIKIGSNIYHKLNILFYNFLIFWNYVLCFLKNIFSFFKSYSTFVCLFVFFFYISVKLYLYFILTNSFFLRYLNQPLIINIDALYIINEIKNQNIYKDISSNPIILEEDLYRNFFKQFINNNENKKDKLSFDKLIQHDSKKVINKFIYKKNYLDKYYFHILRQTLENYRYLLTKTVKLYEIYITEFHNFLQHFILINENINKKEYKNKDLLLKNIEFENSVIKERRRKYAYINIKHFLFVNNYCATKFDKKGDLIYIIYNNFFKKSFLPNSYIFVDIFVFYNLLKFYVICTLVYCRKKIHIKKKNIIYIGWDLKANNEKRYDKKIHKQVYYNNLKFIKIPKIENIYKNCKFSSFYIRNCLCTFNINKINMCNIAKSINFCGNKEIFFVDKINYKYIFNLFVTNLLWNEDTFLLKYLKNYNQINLLNEDYLNFITILNNEEKHTNKVLNTFFGYFKFFLLNAFRCIFRKIESIYIYFFCHILFICFLKYIFLFTYIRKECFLEKFHNFLNNILSNDTILFSMIKYTNNKHENKNSKMDCYNSLDKKNKLYKNQFYDERVVFRNKSVDDSFENMDLNINKYSRKIQFKKINKSKNKNKELATDDNVKKKVNGKSIKNYIIFKRINEMIIKNIKNIYEKIASIERLTNINNYIDIKEKLKKFYEGSDKNCIYDLFDENKFVNNISSSIISNMIHGKKNNNNINENFYKIPLNTYGNEYEYCNDYKYTLNTECVPYYQNNTYDDQNFHNEVDNRYNSVDKIRRLVTLKNELSSFSNMINTSLMKKNKVYKRILSEENSSDLFRSKIINDKENDKTIDRVRNNLYENYNESNRNNGSYFFNIKEIKDVSNVEKSKSFFMCKKKENNFFNFDLSCTNDKENILRDDIIMFNEKNLNDNLEIFMNDDFTTNNSLENKNILFPYKEIRDINKNDMNITEYYRDKYFYGQYKYDASHYIYDLIVLDISGYIYKISTDGNYYWKYKIVKNIHNYLNFYENEKEEKYCKTIKNEGENNELKLRPLKSLHYRKYLNLSADNSHNNACLKDDEKSIVKKIINNNIQTKINYKKLKKNKNITKRLISNYNGNLYYVNENNEAIPLNINIKDVVNNSPFKSPLFPHIVFIGSRYSSVINLDYDTGDVIRKYDNNFNNISKKKKGNNISNKNERHAENISEKRKNVLTNEYLDICGNKSTGLKYKSNINQKDISIDEESVLEYYSDDENNQEDSPNILNDCNTKNDTYKYLSIRKKNSSKYKLSNGSHKLKKRKNLIKNFFMRLYKRSLLSRYSYYNNFKIIRNRKRNEKKKRKKRQLQISIVKWIIKAVDENSLKKKWITTWVDVGSIFITDSHKRDMSFINSLIEVVGNKLILRPMENNKMKNTYSVSKNANNNVHDEVQNFEKNYINNVEDENKEKKEMNKINSNVKSKNFIFSESISSVFAVKYKNSSHILTLDLIMKQNINLLSEFDNLKSFTYNPINFKKSSTLFLPLANDISKNNESASCNFDENIIYGKKLLHRLNNISVNITSIENDIKYLLSNIIFIYDKHKKIPIDYIYEMQNLIHEYHKTKQKFLFYLPGTMNKKYLSYPYNSKNEGTTHLCEYINKFIDLYFEENEICFDYCSMLNIWDKIFNNYVTDDDCLLLSNLYRVVQNAFAYNNKEFNYLNENNTLSNNEHFLVKKRKKTVVGSRNQELKEYSSIKNKKGWYWNMLYTIILIFAFPFLFIYRIFKKKKSNEDKVIIKKKRLSDYDENTCDELDMKYNLLYEDKLKFKNIIRENRDIDIPKIELDTNIKTNNDKKHGSTEQPTLIDILARHARDTNDSSYYEFNGSISNLLPLHYGRETEYSLHNILNMKSSKTKSSETIKSDIIGKKMFHMHRRRAASQDITNKYSFIVKKKIRSNYKLGNKNYKKNYTDNEKDKKYNRLKEKQVNEKIFDKNDFLSFLTNFNKKFMKKNSQVDHLVKINKTTISNYDYNSNSEENLSDSEKRNKYINSDNENKINLNKKHTAKKYTTEENQTNEEKKNKKRNSKDIENGFINTGKQNNHIKNKIESMVINNNEKINNKSSSARNLSLIKTSHIPYDEPLADFLENGRFMRTFENISLIGQGGFGSVYKVSHRLEPGSPTYAVKFIFLKVSSLDNVSSRRYFREIAANRDIYSKHVVRYYTWWCEEPQFLPMHVIPKEIQNLVKKNKDSFKKHYVKNKKNNNLSDSYEKMKAWETEGNDLKNYKKIIKNKNGDNLKFFSDNELNSKKRSNKKKRILTEKSFSDNLDKNINIKTKKKKKKKKGKKFKYEEKQNYDVIGPNEKYSTLHEKNNSICFASCFQEYDPFDNGYLSEGNRDLIVFAENEEGIVCNNSQIANHENDPDNKKNKNNITDTNKNSDNIEVYKPDERTSHLKHNNPDENIKFNVNDNIVNKKYYDKTNAQSSNANTLLQKCNIEERSINFSLQNDHIEDNKESDIYEKLHKKTKDNYKNASHVKNEKFLNIKKKEETNNKNKEKDKEYKELGNQNGNYDKIRNYKKKKVGPEFSIVLLLQMELCKGYTLRKWLDRSTRSDKPLHFTYCDKNMNHPLEFDLFKQLIKGLKDIHSTCFIHRDLKPDNIFVDPDTYTLKIGDLGLVRFIEEKKREKDLNNKDSTKDNIYTQINQNTLTSQISLKGQIIGTPGYTAPEGGALCDEKADIYSAALILLELLCPRFNTIMERYKRLNDFRNYYTVPDYVKIHLNPWYILMLQMSKPNPADRPSASDLYSKIKVLLDPHLTDFAFSFNDVNVDSECNLIPRSINNNIDNNNINNITNNNNNTTDDNNNVTNNNNNTADDNNNITNNNNNTTDDNNNVTNNNNNTADDNNNITNNNNNTADDNNNITNKNSETKTIRSNSIDNNKNNSNNNNNDIVLVYGVKSEKYK